MDQEEWKVQEELIEYYQEHEKERTEMQLEFASKIKILLMQTFSYHSHGNMG